MTKSETQQTLQELEERLLNDKAFQHILKFAPQSQRELMTFELSKYFADLFTQARTSLKSEMEELNNCEDGCKHKDTHIGHNHHWWMGYKQGISECQRVLDTKLRALK